MNTIEIARFIFTIVLVFCMLTADCLQVHAQGTTTESAGHKTAVVAADNSSSKIKDEADYICTGENDQEIIQEAIDSVKNTGGIVRLKEGVFHLSDNIFINGNNIIFEGAGEDKTLLDWSLGCLRIVYREHVVIRDFKTIGTGAIELLNSSHIKVENVIATIDNSKGGAAFFTTVSEKEVEDIEYINCKAIDCGRHGWQSDGWGKKKLIKDIRYINCQAINCGRYSRYSPHGQWTCGFQLAENSDIDGCEVINCLAEGNWEAGFIVEGTPTIKNMIIRDCISRDNGQKPDDYNNEPDEKTYGCLFGAGFWLNGDITLYNCISENNKKAGFSVWMKPSPLTTKLYGCVDTGSEIGFRLDYTENVYLENCKSINAGKYGIWAANAKNLDSRDLEIVKPGGDGKKSNLFGMGDYPVCDSYFDLNTYGGEGTVISCINGKGVTFTGNVHSNSPNPIIVTGSVDISELNIKPYKDTYFNDIEDYPWAKDAIEGLAEKGIIKGTSENKFSPELNITRADFLLLLIRTLGISDQVDSNFKDVKPEDYYYEAVGIGKKLGITKGSGNNMFNPNSPILRQDMMVLICNALKISQNVTLQEHESKLSSFNDLNEISPYAVDSISFLVANGVVEGNENRINPLQNATRAESAVLINRIFKLVNPEEVLK